MLSSADKRALQKKLRAIFQRYAQLDSALWYLQTDPAMIRARIRQYQTEINGLLKTETLKDSVIKDDVQKSLDSFAKNLTAYLTSDELKKRLPRLEALQSAVYTQYATQIDTITNHLGATLGQRGATFRAMANAAEIPLARAAQIEGYTLRAISLGGKTYNSVQLGEYWARMLKEYGTRGSIQYRNGANYPLTTYIDQRINTSRAETDRLTAVVSGSALGLTLGQINQDGTTDSCIYWENKYVFFSEEAKAQTLAKYPNSKQLASIPTVQDVKDDKTHMFKWNCKHRILPTSITVLDPQEFAKEFDSTAATQPKIPKRIDEAKIYESVTGEKYAPAPGGQIDQMRATAIQEFKRAAYTIQ
jgi:hypothetical protein